MIHKFTLLVLLLASIFVSSAHADTIYDNGLEVEDSDFYSISFLSTLTNHQFQVADRFSFGAAGPFTVTSASWIGGLFDENSFQNGVGVALDFDIMFFADNGGQPTGTPLDTIPGTSLEHRFVENVVGTLLPTSPFDNLVAGYSANFAPVVLDGLTDYWMVISARGDFTFEEIGNTMGSGWAWGGRSSTGNAWQGGTGFQENWVFQARQQGFSLDGFAGIPEPSGTIVVFGWIVIASLKRRRLPIRNASPTC